MSEIVDIIKRSGNEALKINKPYGVDFHITEHGSDWLWAVFAMFGFCLVIYAFIFFFLEKKTTRLMRYALAPAILISFYEFFSYYTYASNLGWAGVHSEFNHLTVKTSISGETPGFRQVFYTKFIAWVLSWPALIVLQELANVTSTDQDISVLELCESLLVQIFGTTIWIVSLLIGTLIHSTYKWGYWTFGAFAMLVTEYVMIRRQYFTNSSNKFLQLKSFCFMVVMLIVWLYFVCWGLCEGGNVIQPDGEAVFYGVLDVCLFCFYPIILVVSVYKGGNNPNFTMTGAKGENHWSVHKHNDEEANAGDDESHGKEVQPDSPRASGATAFQNENEGENTAEASV